MPQDFIAQTVIDTVLALPDIARKRILDLSCGEGEILEALDARGCTVEGTHYTEGDYIIEAAREVLSRVPVHKNVALDAPLPFDDASYDVVILTEVIEHLPNHVLIISEISRILAPGGVLVLTTPNIQRLHSRMQFLLMGTHKLIRRRIAWDIPRDRLYEFHINPLDFHTAHAMLGIHGLHLRKMRFTRVKARHLYLLVLYPIIKLMSWLEGNRKNENDRHRMTERDLFARMTGKTVLLSEQLCMVAEKDDGKRG